MVQFLIIHSGCRLTMKPLISASELSALTAISDDFPAAKKPSLGLRYRLISGSAATLSIFISVIAACNPALFITELISPSIIPDEQLITNTRIRGIFTFFLILLWLVSHKNKKYTLSLILGMLFWTTTITAIDLYKLFNLQIFTATIASTVFLLIRPLIFVALVTMSRDVFVYLKAIKRYERASIISFC